MKDRINAIVGALESWAIDLEQGRQVWIPVSTLRSAAKALSEHPAQPESEAVRAAWMDGYTECEREAIEKAQQQEPSHSDQQLAEQIMSDCGCSTNNQRLLERITERLAKHRPAQQQRPIAWMNPDDLCADTAFRWSKIDEFTKPLYTSPPYEATPLASQSQSDVKPWVGLTRAERFEIEKTMSKYYDYQHECKTVCLPEFARAIEDKLKEKNGF